MLSILALCLSCAPQGSLLEPERVQGALVQWLHGGQVYFAEVASREDVLQVRELTRGRLRIDPGTEPLAKAGPVRPKSGVVVVVRVSVDSGGTQG